MTITLDLPPQLEAQLHAAAARQQITPDAFVTRLVSSALPATEMDEKIERSRALLRALAEIGDEQEQRETFAYLQQAVNEDSLSDRDRF